MLKATLVKKLGLNVFQVKFSDTSSTYEVSLKGNCFYYYHSNNPVNEQDSVALFNMLRAQIINFNGDI